MNITFSRIAAPVLFAVTIALGACKQGDNPQDALAQDTSLARDLQLANADTMVLPQLKDVPATVEPAQDAASPAPRVAQRQTPAEILTPSRNPRRVATTPRATPQPVTPAPAPVTENGNTVTAGTAGSEREIGTIASGSAIALFRQRVCTNTYAWVTVLPPASPSPSRGRTECRFRPERPR